MKHIIGIDFGTSTTMLKVREEEDVTASDNLECRPVTFTQSGIASTPTLIRMQGDTRWYGHEAERNAVPDSQLYDNFKLLLRKKDTREQAAVLIDEFFSWLFQTYSEQRPFLYNHLDGGITEETKVSYPAQWGGEQKTIMLEAARKAGFPNVVGEDEATAAVVCVLKAKQKELEKKGFLRAGRPIKILIIDMGAGTTDLAFVEVSVANGQIQTKLLDTWPQGNSEHIFGGHQIDEGLEVLLEQWLIDCGLSGTAKQMVGGQTSNIKAWKENTVSVLLRNGKSVDDFSGLSTNLQMMSMMGMPIQRKPFPSIDRAVFERQFKSELSAFVEVVNSAPEMLRENVELVILTGGNSQWYWIDDVILGRNGEFGDVGLTQVKGQPDRLLRMELPAETVSRGLVYGAGGFVVEQPEPKFELDPEQETGELKSIAQHTPGLVVKVLPVTEQAIEYADEVCCKLNNLGFGALSDSRLVKIGQKIRDASIEKIPYILIIRDKDVEDSTVYPHCSGEHLNAMTLNQFVAMLEKEIKNETVGVGEAAQKMGQSQLPTQHMPRIVVEERQIREKEESMFPLKYDPRSMIRPVICAAHHTVAVDRTGSVKLTTRDPYKKNSGWADVDTWSDIVSVASGGKIVGLKRDGTVVACGLHHNTWPYDFDASSWHDIIAVEESDVILGLKSNGTVMASTGWDKYDVSSWKDIVSIVANHNPLDRFIGGLRKDGTVTVAVNGRKNENELIQRNVAAWRDITAIAAGHYHMVGLKQDGTVVAVCTRDYGACNVGEWRDIVAIAAGGGCTVGLKRDGTVMAVGKNHAHQCDVSSWKNIIAISTGGSHTVGLKSDGTIIATGDNGDWQCSSCGGSGTYWRSRSKGFLKGWTWEPVKSTGTPWKLF